MKIYCENFSIITKIVDLDRIYNFPYKKIIIPKIFVSKLFENNLFHHLDIWHKKNSFYKTCEDPYRKILSMKLSDLAQIKISIFKEVSGRLFESTFKIIQSDNILMQKTTLEKNSDKLRPSLAIIYHWSRSLESGLIFLKIRKTNWQYLVVNFLCKIFCWNPHYPE